MDFIRNSYSVELERIEPQYSQCDVVSKLFRSMLSLSTG